MNRPTFPVTQKVWGYEELIVNNAGYCAKFLVIKPGGQCSLHSHKIKTETFTVMEGECKFQHGDAYEDESIKPVLATITLSRGQQVDLPPGTVHRFAVDPKNNTSCTILEVSTHHEDSDSYRLAPSKIIGETKGNGNKD